MGRGERIHTRKKITSKSDFALTKRLVAGGWTPHLSGGGDEGGNQSTCAQPAHDLRALKFRGKRSKNSNFGRKFVEKFERYDMRNINCALIKM